MAYIPFQNQDAVQSEGYAFSPDRYMYWLPSTTDPKPIGSPFIEGENSRAFPAQCIGSPFISGGGDD